jgi:hypothetical protein
VSGGAGPAGGSGAGAALRSPRGRAAASGPGAGRGARPGAPAFGLPTKAVRTGAPGPTRRRRTPVRSGRSNVARLAPSGPSSRTIPSGGRRGGGAKPSRRRATRAPETGTSTIRPGAETAGVVHDVPRPEAPASGRPPTGSRDRRRVGRGGTRGAIRPRRGGLRRRFVRTRGPRPTWSRRVRSRFAAGPPDAAARAGGGAAAAVLRGRPPHAADRRFVALRRRTTPPRRPRRAGGRAVRPETRLVRREARGSSPGPGLADVFRAVPPPPTGRASGPRRPASPRRSAPPSARRRSRAVGRSRRPPRPLRRADDPLVAEPPGLHEPSPPRRPTGGGRRPATRPDPRGQSQTEDNHIVCPRDGKKLEMLKRHLITAYSMTMERYPAK